MQLIKTWLTGCLITLGLIPIVTANSQSIIIDEVIAVVGDSPILKSDVESQYQQAMIQGVSFTGDLKCHIFEQLLIQNLLIEQAKIDSVVVNENMVIMTVDRQVNELVNRAGSRERLEEWLNKPLPQIKRDQRVVVRNQMLTQQVQGSITDNVRVTPAEVREFYRNTPSDSLPMVPSMVEVQKIKIEPEIDPEDIESIKERLRGFQRQVAEGRDFVTIAVLFSEDNVSAARGGELGFMTRAELVPEFAQAAFNLREPGQVSHIVETEFGFHIIQLIERQGDRINVRHVLLRPKPRPEAIARAQQRADSIAGIISEGKITFEAAAARFSMDTNTRLTGGLLINPNDQSSRFEIQQLSPEINRQIQGMEAGGVSNSFRMRDERSGSDYFAVVRLRSRTQPSRANMRDNYQLLQTILENRKRQETFQKWIARKQTETYISISPEWGNCRFEFEGWRK